MKMLKLLSALSIWLLMCEPSFAETGQLLVNTDLKSEPFSDSQTLGSLQSNSAVEILKRQGGWMQVKPAGGGEGWVKMTSVKLGGGAAGTKGDSGLGELWNVARSGRSGNTGVTVATGVRGLGAEDLKNAKPNPDAVKKLKSYAVSRPDAESFAGSARLQRQTPEYLPAKPGGGSDK
jgi:hypothetical protein